MWPNCDEAAGWFQWRSWSRRFGERSRVSYTSWVSDVAFTSVSDCQLVSCCAHFTFHMPTKSCAVSGVPSDHLTPGVRFTVMTYLVPAATSLGGLAGISAGTSL